MSEAEPNAGQWIANPGASPRFPGELFRLHPPRAIHDETNFRNTQEVVDALTNLPRPSAGQLEYLDTLSVLMEGHENEHHRIEVAGITPLATLKHVVQESGMSVSELGKVIGSKSAASMILGGRREMSKAQIKALADHFRVDPGLFL